MEDINIKDDEVSYQFLDDPYGVALEWETNESTGRLWFRNSDLERLRDWLNKRHWERAK